MENIFKVEVYNGEILEETYNITINRAKVATPVVDKMNQEDVLVPWYLRTPC